MTGNGTDEASDARRALYLPDGYSLDEAADSELATLRREDGSIVARFGAQGADRRSIEAAAWEDARPAQGGP